MATIDNPTWKNYYLKAKIVKRLVRSNSIKRNKELAPMKNAWILGRIRINTNAYENEVNGR